MARRQKAAFAPPTYPDAFKARNAAEALARDKGHGVGACAMELECWRCSAHGWVTYHTDKQATFTGEIFTRDCGT